MKKRIISYRFTNKHAEQLERAICVLESGRMEQCDRVEGGERLDEAEATATHWRESLLLQTDQKHKSS